jgi:hypothetical protein
MPSRSRKRGRPLHRPVIPAQAGTQTGQGHNPRHPPRPRKTPRSTDHPLHPPRPHLGPRVRGDDGVFGQVSCGWGAGRAAHPHPRHSRASGNPDRARAPRPPPAPSTKDSCARRTTPSATRPVPIWVPACAGMTVFLGWSSAAGEQGHAAHPTPVIPAHAGTQTGQGHRARHPPRPRKTLALDGPPHPPPAPSPSGSPRARG